MEVYAVIDTNVLVSALLAKHPDSAPVQILDRLFSRDFIPMYNEEILAEYSEVLHRPKFKFPEDAIIYTLDAIIEAGIESSRISSSEEVSDPKDLVFYEIAMSREDSYLVTGNIKHFPAVSRVITPNKMLDAYSGARSASNSSLKRSKRCSLTYKK